MSDAPSPVKPFLRHALWVVVPFAVLVGLTWYAWRADAEIRRTRALEAARVVAERTLEEARNGLGAWSAVPGGAGVEAPPLPDEGSQSAAARARYQAGDFEGVLGSPESLRSAAGLSLRRLAALQLLRRETDPARLGELAAVLAGELDFTSPQFLEAAERRYVELKIEPPPVLSGWRDRWLRLQTETGLAGEQAPGGAPAVWMERDGGSHLVERRGNGGEWRVRRQSEVEQAAGRALTASVLPDGLGLRIAVAGRVVAGSADAPRLAGHTDGGWSSDVVLADSAAWRRGEVRMRNFVAAVLAVAGLAVGFGLFQAGRAYLRAVELARRQAAFTAAVSHEMRTPLAAMLLLSENLESGVAERTGKRAEHIRIIRSECARLSELVGNVLEFHRKDPQLEFDPFDIRALMFSVDELVRPLAEKRGIALETRVEIFPEAPSGDADALRRAFVNLADNALKHSPDGGSVRCHAAPTGDGRWSLVVTDHGPGVPPRERKKIFEPFYRIGDELRRTTTGTGLGLALVKRTVTAHHGAIAVDEAPGGGARFTLTLPIRPDFL